MASALACNWGGSGRFVNSKAAFLLRFLDPRVQGSFPSGLLRRQQSLRRVTLEPRRAFLHLLTAAQSVGGIATGCSVLAGPFTSDEGLWFDRRALGIANVKLVDVM